MTTDILKYLGVETVSEDGDSHELELIYNYYSIGRREITYNIHGLILSSTTTIKINQGEITIVHIDLKMSCQEQNDIILYPRNELATKYGLQILTPYQESSNNEIIFKCAVTSLISFEIEEGDAICTAIFNKVIEYSL